MNHHSWVNFSKFNINSGHLMLKVTASRNYMYVTSKEKLKDGPNTTMHI